MFCEPASDDKSFASSKTNTHCSLLQQQQQRLFGRIAKLLP
jgi:hypothetical protein